MYKKITNLTVINTISFVLGIILYCVITFFIKDGVASKYKELENVVLVAIPCLLIFIYSFMIDNPNKRKNSLIFYLVGYLIVTFGFVFSIYRSNILIEQGIMFREYNLIPFHSIINLFQSLLGQKFAIYNIVGNFLMLTPLAILLPMIHKKFTKTKSFLLVIIILCFFIEITQYITGLGSFDIDDFILNISGTLILFLIIKKTSLSLFIENIFLKQKFSRKLCCTIYILLLFTFLMFFVKRTLLVYNNYSDHKIDMSNAVCMADSKVYLGDIGNYSYYSKCNYENSYILVGKQKYKIKEFIKSQSFNDTFLKKLNLERKIIITNAILTNKFDRQKFRLFKTDYSSVYLYGYANLLIEKNKILYDVKTELEKKSIDISVIHSLTKLKVLDNKKGYSVETGKYFNIVTCGGNYAYYNEFYILEPKFVITKDICSTLNSLSF